MGSNEEGKSSKSEKSSPSAPEQSNVHVYPDWAAMQAYYGPRVAIPPYYNSNVAPGHAPPPYMWAPPSPMMAPYGAPYPAFCPPGGVYAHPGVPMTQGPVVQASPAATTPLSMDTPAKSPGNTDQGFMKKLKEFDGLAMSIGNGKVESSEHDEPRSSPSSENEGSSNGSDGNTTGGEQSKRKRSREGLPAIDGGPLTQASPHPPGEVNGKPTASMVSPAMCTALELQGTSGMNGTPQPCAVMPPENEKELKRERRKQSNRESARRSRLRKQAETEELARKVDALTAENMTLRSELNILNEKSEKLRLDNAELLEKLKAAQARGKTENLLCRVENKEAGSGGGETRYEKSSKNVQHQLMDASPRTDAVAAS